MSSAEVQWFRSKVDWWMWLILVALPVIELGGLAAALRDGGEAIMSMAVALGIVAAIYGLRVIPIRYGVSSDQLVIRFGVVRRYIDLAAIREVYPTHNPLASPALSLDRLAIRTGHGLFGMSLISPLEREEFLSTLASAARLVRNNDRLVLPGSGDASAWQAHQKKEIEMRTYRGNAIAAGVLFIHCSAAPTGEGAA